MAVLEQFPPPEYRKRKRRRRQDKPAISARLVLDDHIKGEVGIFSEDLFSDLFPGCSTDASGNGTSHDEVNYVAISPWTPTANVEDAEWTVVPVRSSSALAHSTIQFSPTSLALQGFAEALRRNAPSKLLGHSRSGIEIKVLDVVPLTLDSVFVTVEGELAKRLENGEGTFHADGWRKNGASHKHRSAVSPEDSLSSAIREALSSLDVVHMGDYFGLPLAPHPVTHLPPQPARVTLCEPTSQGILSAKTKIIVTQTRHRSKASRKAQPMQSLNGLTEDDDDTANDQFYSAAEDKYKTDHAVADGDSVTESEAESSAAEDDNLSDDSMDDMISLQAPILSSTSVSGVSTLQAGTPRTIPLGRGTNGINTPGSVYSTMTATTSHAGNQKGRLFKAQGLLRTLPMESLHPKPGSDDDEEIRVFVDVNSLAKIGCFSGDWVRLEAAAEPPPSGIGLWGLGTFDEDKGVAPIWRPARVYSLPESYSNRPVTKIPTRTQDGRRPSFFESQVQKPSSPVVHLSPILLANLDNSPYLRLSPLKRPIIPGNPSPKITGTSMPPFAREITLAKIATPFATERSLQAAFLAGLKRHFGQRIRLVKDGDLVGIPIDGGLGSTLYQPSSMDDNGDELLAAADLNQFATASRNTGIAWFKVHHVTSVKSDASTEDLNDIWGGLASIDPSSTRMVQSGVEKSKLPTSSGNAWEYYFALKDLPKGDTSSMHKMLPEPSHQHVTKIRRRLRELFAAATSPRAIHMKLPPLAILLVSTQRNIGKATVATRACTDIGLHTFSIDAYDILSEGGAGGGDVKTEAFLKARAERAMTCGSEFCALLIRHVEALTADRITSALKDILAESRILIATTTEVDKVPDGIRGLFTHELEMNAPDEFEREGILRGIVEGYGVALAPDVDMSGVAVKTAALVAGDLVDVVDRAVVAKRERIEGLAIQPITIRDVQISGGLSCNCLTKGDFDLAIDAARNNFADAIGAPKIPNVGWDDVGGLSNVKDAVMETIQLPLERPELFARGMKKRSGILFYGPPGTGKTLLAKAIATEFSLNFFSVKGPELLNMYIGESEANVRRVFQRARDARPCVVFFDELDSVAPKRGNQGDSGGVMDRIVSQLLAELDGMSDGEEGAGGVFVIGATNRPDLLDAALLRPGRFDKMLYLGVSDTHDKQLTIMEALTRKFTLHPNTSLRRVADTLPFTYTGADFYALCSDAMLKAVTRQASAVDEKIKRLPGGPVSTAYFFDHYATKEDIAVMVTEEDFLAAQRELIPSVSAKELEHYARVRQTFEAVGEKKEPQTGIPEWQRPHRASLSSTHSSRSSNQGKSRSGKGKGKARASFDQDNGDSDHSMNGDGPRASKGKGKAVDNGFKDTTLEDDEDLY